MSRDSGRHAGDRRLGDHVGRPQVRLEHPIELLRGLVADERAGEDARRVHHYGRCAGLLHHPVHLVGAGAVGCHIARPELLGRLGQPLGAPGREHHVIAALHEDGGARLADAATAARHHRHPCAHRALLSSAGCT